MLIQAIRVIGDEGALRESRTPRFRDSALAICGSCKLAIDGARSVGVVSQIDREEGPFSKRFAMVERPEGCLEALHDVPRALDFRRRLSLEGTCGDLVDFIDQRMLIPVPWNWTVAFGQELLFADAVGCPSQ